MVNDVNEFIKRRAGVLEAPLKNFDINQYFDYFGRKFLISPVPLNMKEEMLEKFKDKLVVINMSAAVTANHPICTTIHQFSEDLHLTSSFHTLKLGNAVQIVTSSALFFRNIDDYLRFVDESDNLLVDIQENVAAKQKLNII